MKKWVKYIAIWAVAVIFMFGQDIKTYNDNRLEYKSLRNDVCTLMVSKKLLHQEALESCKQFPSTYRNGVTAAAIVELPRIRSQIQEEIQSLNSEHIQLDTSKFVNISFEDFWSKAMETQAVSPSAPSEYYVFDVSWLMLTGYGQLRAEKEPELPKIKGQTGVALDISPNIRGGISSLLRNLCSREYAIFMQCSGTIYVQADHNTIFKRYVVQAINLEPISDQHIIQNYIDYFLQDSEGTSTGLKNGYMKRFLERHSD